MQHAKKSILTVTAIIMLTGCTTNYQAALQQKLDGKPVDEKRAILAQACAAEISNGSNQDPDNIEHFKKMKGICEEMTGKKVSVGR